MESVERCPLERRRGSSKGHPHLRQSGRRSARTLPPLSWTLRDSPEPQVRPRSGLTPSVSGGSNHSAAAFQSALPPAVLLPESFRGGCSFGAADPCSSRGRDLSCGRAYSATGVAPISAEGQPVPIGDGLIVDGRVRVANPFRHVTAAAGGFWPDSPVSREQQAEGGRAFR